MVKYVHNHELIQQQLDKIDAAKRKAKRPKMKVSGKSVLELKKIITAKKSRG